MREVFLIPESELKAEYESLKKSLLDKITNGDNQEFEERKRKIAERYFVDDLITPTVRVEETMKTTWDRTLGEHDSHLPEVPLKLDLVPLEFEVPSTEVVNPQHNHTNKNNNGRVYQTKYLLIS